MYFLLFVLTMVGGTFLLFSAFGFFLGFVEPNGRHGAGGIWKMSLLGTFLLLVGIGFLMPQRLLKLVAGLLLAGGAIYTFCEDAFRKDNWWIYCLLLCPLVLALSLDKKYGNSTIWSATSVN